MASEAQIKYDDIANYIKAEGGITARGIQRSNWYCGITNDIEERLFGYHNVLKRNICWVWHECSSDSVARDVEKALIDTGYGGGTGGGGSDTVFVYAYRHRLTTKR